MAEMIKTPNSELAPPEEINESALIELSNGLLFDARAEIPEQKT